MEQIKKVTFDFIVPIGLVIGLLTGFYQLGQIANQVDVNTVQIKSVNESLATFPTRMEFQSLLDDVKYIRNNFHKE